ncbi:TPA: hypothetical protein HA318_01855 [Candidatus Micrarchaeota archaeon]|nr:MAG: hypothetical protein AUJ65_05565 [Candidatus Micrarchaeota archaeon CG1_02_51_15]HII38727.1 hypothetical protein [Candidatus Micrarchaeota archaeon]
MYADARVLKRNAVEQMVCKASRLREEYLNYVEDLQLHSNPEFWKAIADVENRRTKKTTLKQLKEELSL